MAVRLRRDAARRRDATSLPCRRAVAGLAAPRLASAGPARAPRLLGGGVCRVGSRWRPPRARRASPRLRLAAPARPPPAPPPRAQAAEVEETIKRISSHKGVQGILVANFEGVALKSTLPPALAAQYAGLFSTLVAKARSTVRSLDADNDLVFLRVRTKKHEVMVAPDREFILVVVQDVNVSGGGH